MSWTTQGNDWLLRQAQQVPAPISQNTALDKYRPGYSWGVLLPRACTGSKPLLHATERFSSGSARGFLCRQVQASPSQPDSRSGGV
jgi:hypothetical protein